MTPPLVKVENVKQYFPSVGDCFRAPLVTSGRWMTFRSAFGGRNVGAGRRNGLRQNDRRPHATATVWNRPRAGFCYDGQDVTTLAGSALRELRRHMQIVFQDPFGSLNPRMTVAGIVEEGSSFTAWAIKPAARRRCRETLEQVGLDPQLRNRYPHEFSGGQRQRIGIARALALRPDLHGARRADLGARRFDSIADHQSAASTCGRNIN